MDVFLLFLKNKMRGSQSEYTIDDHKNGDETSPSNGGTLAREAIREENGTSSNWANYNAN